jgi:hypothetical protein
MTISKPNTADSEVALDHEKGGSIVVEFHPCPADELDAEKLFSVTSLLPSPPGSGRL